MGARESLLAELAADPRSCPRAVQALSRVPRERFVPPQLRELAWEDRPLPIGDGQTISQPSLVALMTSLLGLRPGDSVLDVGTGSGYQTAVLAELLGLGPGALPGAPRGRLATVERLPGLALSAQRRLESLGYRGLAFRTGDGGLGWPEQAPFNAIVVSAATPVIAEAWLEQLVPGGHVVAPVGSGEVQQLQVVEKRERGPRVELGPFVQFVPLVRDD